MRILYVCSDPSIRAGGRGGGFRTHMEEMIHSFRKLGHEVVVLDTKRGPGAEQDPRGGRIRDVKKGMGRGADSAGRFASRSSDVVGGRGVRMVPRSLRVFVRDCFYLFHNVLFSSRMASLLKEERPFDFVYERYAIYQFAASGLARRRGIPLVLEFNASIDETKLTGGLGLRPIAAAVETSVTRRADAVVAVSGFLKRHLGGLGLPPEKVHVLHNGVNLQKFHPGIDGQAIRDKFGFSRSDVVVGFVGGFSVWHGVHLLHEVAPLAAGESRNLRFFMVGGRQGNPRFETFRDKVSEQGLGHLFRFAGEIPREDVPEHVAAMDVAIIPWATDYGSPTKTFEYMGMAKALVAPRVPALEEVLETGTTAMLVPPGDVREIARALVLLARDPGLRQGLGRRARKAVEDTYNWDRNAAVTLDIASSVIEERRRKD
ncbi:MAG: glycosyltransferase family 4 protein [Candidatus Eiseniibacteriota bacterium]|nr:MAG: glycosyltransferase family 4 protein [Candidatus Eisenbacteria bacterium]